MSAPGSAQASGPATSAPASRAVILLAVGPLGDGEGQRFRQTAARLAERLGGVPVLAACVVPRAAGDDLSLTRAVERQVAAGAGEIAVVPYLVEWRTGEWQDVPDTVQELARAHPEVRFRLAQPLGTADGLVEVLASRSAGAWSLPVSGSAPEVPPAAAPPSPATRGAPAPPAAGGAPSLPAHGTHVLACFGRVCQQYGSDAIYGALMAELAGRGLDADGAGRDPGAPWPPVKVTRTKCLSPCAGAALVCVYPGGDFYWNLSPELMPRFVDEVLAGGKSLPGHTFRPGEGDPPGAGADGPARPGAG
jgi:(2Fe-2S) ferredoxin